MAQYLKNLLQLVLLPFRGWEDVSASMSDPELLLQKGYYPLLGFASMTELVRLLYSGHGGFLTVLELAIALFGSFFVAFFIAKIILNHYLAPYVDGEISATKIATFIIYGLGLLLIIEIIDNLLPTNLTLVKFLPLFVALILYNGSNYLSIKQGCELRFLLVVTLGVIVVPLAIFYLLELIIA